MTKQNDQTNQLMIRELCRILEVQADVTVQDLKKAYYRLAKRFHPDKNPSDALATNQFILVSSAYQTLRSELTLDDIPNTEQATNVHQKTTVRRANSAQKPTNTDTTLSPASKPSRHKYEGIQIDELLARLFQTNFNNITTKTDTNNTTQARHCPKDERQKLSDNLTETDSKFPDRTSSQTAKEIIFNSDQWLAHQQDMLKAFRTSRRSSLPHFQYDIPSGRLCRKSTTDMRRLTHHSDLLPVVDKAELLRCSHCYRTFQPEIATKHVEHCSRKASEKDGYVPNSLGQTVVSGCSPTLIRTRQSDNSAYGLKKLVMQAAPRSAKLTRVYDGLIEPSFRPPATVTCQTDREQEATGCLYVP